MTKETDKEANEQTNSFYDKRNERNRQTDKQTNSIYDKRKKRNGQTNKRTNKQTNEQTDEQTSGFFDKRKRNKTDLSIRIISRKIINSKNKRIYREEKSIQTYKAKSGNKNKNKAFKNSSN
jgi:hypothetical protein